VWVAELPSGTVTFLFSDVVGSTRLWAADAEAMSASLWIHDQIFRDAFAEFDGYVFATAGDSFAAAFGRASAAVDCAEAIQAALARAEWGAWPALRVRIGLHVGEAEERDGNYFGPVVNQTARVMAVAHGGQVLLTAMVRDSAAVTATDLGTHTLRDIDTPVHLHQLGTEEFPPLLSVGKGIVSQNRAARALRRLSRARRFRNARLGSAPPARDGDLCRASCADGHTYPRASRWTVTSWIRRPVIASGRIRHQCALSPGAHGSSRRCSISAGLAS
jgi:class 3 adenylate cyclase